MLVADPDPDPAAPAFAGRGSVAHAAAAAGAAAASPATRFTRRVHRLMLATTLLLLLCAGIGVVVLREAADRRDWVTRTAAIQLETERLRAILLGVGRMAQQEVLGGKSAEAAVAVLRAAHVKDWTDLRALVDGPEQRGILDKLRPLIDERFDLLATPMSTVNANLDPLVLDAQAQARLALVRRLEILLDEFIRGENAFRNQREQAVTNAARTIGGLIIVMALLGIVLVALATRVVRHEIQRRATAERDVQRGAAALQQLNAGLERRVGERTMALNDRNRALSGMHERLAIVSREVLRVAENERRSLARELHDDLGQQMAALKMNLQMMRLYPRGLQSHIDDSIQLVQHCIIQLRERALSLRPPMLDELGLAEALRVHATVQARRAGVCIEMALSTEFDAADVDWTSAVYRIVQEAMRNAVAHAGATQLSLSLQADGDSVLLRVGDDGRWAGPTSAIEALDTQGATDAAASTSLGLLTMRERTELLRGEFRLLATEPQGTEIRCRWPRRVVLRAEHRVAPAAAAA